MKLASAVAALVLLAPAACGGSDSSFAEDYNQAVRPLSQLGQGMGTQASEFDRLARRTEQTRANLAVVQSEQERLEEQIKLIRADAVASRNTATLTARIDSTVEHLHQTNKWLSEMDEFKDLTGDIPSTPCRYSVLRNRKPLSAAKPQIAMTVAPENGALRKNRRSIRGSTRRGS